MSDIYPLFREAEVISTKDPYDLGRIQLRVFPELANIPAGDLPWCLPMASGPHDGDFSTPLTKQWVYCTVWNKYWSEVSFLPWCMPDPQKPKFNDFKNTLISKVKDYEGSPDIQHCVGSILEDTFVRFHDTKASQHGFLHPSETYGLINKLGEIFIQSVKRLFFHNKEKDVWLDANSVNGDIVFETKGNVIKTIKKDKTTLIEGGLAETIKKDKTTTVEGSETKEITEDKTENISGDENRYIDGDRTININGSESQSISGDYTLSVGGVLNIKVGGTVKINGSTIHLN
jgi:hypothetical protein